MKKAVALNGLVWDMRPDWVEHMQGVFNQAITKGDTKGLMMAKAVFLGG